MTIPPRYAALAPSLIVAIVSFAGCGSKDSHAPSAGLVDGTGTGGSAGSVVGFGGKGVGASGGAAGNAAGGKGGAVGVGPGGSSSAAGGMVAGCVVDPTPAPSAGKCIASLAGYACNPISNAGCTAGQSCDFDGTGFTCFPSASPAPACGACHLQSGPFCGAGSTCYGGLDGCTAFCCDSNDCGAGAKCVLQPPTALGICQATGGGRLATFTGSGGSTSAGGSSAAGGAVSTGGNSAGGGSGGALAMCTVPPFATPSMGACLTITSGAGMGGNSTGKGGMPGTGGQTGGLSCNPITNEGCNGATQCDYLNGGFSCLPGPHTAASCQACPFASACIAGNSCVMGQCRKICCSSDDCGGKPCVNLALGVTMCGE